MQPSIQSLLSPQQQTPAAAAQGAAQPQQDFQPQQQQTGSFQPLSGTPAAPVFPGQGGIVVQQTSQSPQQAQHLDGNGFAKASHATQPRTGIRGSGLIGTRASVQPGSIAAVNPPPQQTQQTTAVANVNPAAVQRTGSLPDLNHQRVVNSTLSQSNSSSEISRGNSDGTLTASSGTPPQGKKKKGGLRGMFGMKSGGSNAASPRIERAKGQSFSVPIDPAPFQSSAREKLVYEVLTTERSYVNGLRLMLTHYVDDPDCPFSDSDKEKIFANVEQVRSFSHVFCFPLFPPLKTNLSFIDLSVPLQLLGRCDGETARLAHRSELADWRLVHQVLQVSSTLPGVLRQLRIVSLTVLVHLFACFCCCLGESLPRLLTFSPFSLGLFLVCSAQEYFVMLKKKNKKLATYSAARIPECNGLDLSSLLITPVQRVPRYVMLLTDLVKHTDAAHPDHAVLEEALVKVRESAGVVNTGISDIENQNRFEGIATRVKDMGALVAPHRHLVRDGYVSCNVERDEGVYMLLLNDILVVLNAIAPEAKAKQPESAQATLQDMARFEVLRTLDLSACDVRLESNPVAVRVTDANFSALLKFQDAAAAPSWCESIAGAATAWREKQRDDFVELHPGVWRFKNGNVFRAANPSSASTLNPAVLDGEGTMEYVAGGSFTGTWVANVPTRGRLATRDGIAFEGTFENGLRTGRGTMTWTNGASYEGEFVNGRFHGEGTYRSPTGDSQYAGSWVDGRRTGQGSLLITTASPERQQSYTGSWLNDQRHGEGHLRCSSGVEYHGAFEHDQRHGHGVLKEIVAGALAVVYDGGWQNNLRHGQGMAQNVGVSYTGGYENDLYHGQGTLANADGQYIGEFKSGRRHGKGTWRSAAQRIAFDGEWQDGRYHGQGRLECFDACSSSASSASSSSSSSSSTSGDTAALYTVHSPGAAWYDGAWVSGRREGKGTQKYVDGSTYNGTWRADLRHGFGVFTSSDGAYVYDGVWKQDVRGGTGRESFGERGQPAVIIEASFANGRPRGDGEVKYADGRTLKTGFGEHGGYHGVSELKETASGRVLAALVYDDGAADDAKCAPPPNPAPPELPSLLDMVRQPLLE
jgi:hypothetical protein